MTAAASLLAQLHAAGIDLRVDGDKLRYRPKPSPDLLAAMATHKEELLAALAAEEDAVAWRVQAMRPQVPRSGPIAFLVARPNPKPGACLSCGEPLEAGRRWRCHLCQKAAERAITEVRESA